MYRIAPPTRLLAGVGLNRRGAPCQAAIFIMPRWSSGSGHRFFIGVSLTTAPPHFGTKKPKALKFTEHREVAGSNPVRGTTSWRE